MQKRNVFAKREILASDINEFQNYIIHNEQLLLKDALGCTNAIITGLDISGITGLDYVVQLGSYHKDGTVYELLNNYSATLPNIAGTYNIYATLGVTDDTPISGYSLLDTALRTETYDVVNVRTYDSISLGATTGTIPSGSIQIGQLVSNGTSITSYIDQRVFITFGNLTSYSLQNFSLTGANTAFRTGKVNGIIYDDSNALNNIFANVSIDDSHAGTGFKVNTGNNSSATGYLANINNNIGFNAVSTGTGSIGFNSNIGATNTSFNGLASSRTATTGLNLSGYNKAINITDSNIGINLIDNYANLYIENTTELAVNQYIAKFKAFGSTSEGGGGAFPIFSNQILSFTGSGVNQSIIQESSLIFANYVGSYYENNNINGSSRAIYIDNHIVPHSVSIELLEVGYQGLFIRKSNSTGLPIVIYNNQITQSAIDNPSICIEQDHNTIGLRINKTGALSTESYGIVIGDGGISGTATNKLKTGIIINGALQGFDIRGFNEFGAMIDGLDNISTITGLVVKNVNQVGINISNCKTYGLEINQGLSGKAHIKLDKVFGGLPADTRDGQLVFIQQAGVDKLMFKKNVGWGEIAII